MLIYKNHSLILHCILSRLLLDFKFISDCSGCFEFPCLIFRVIAKLASYALHMNVDSSRWAEIN